MRYNQVKDLVVWAADFHARMAKQFSDAAENADAERLKMALTYLANRELRMKTGLEDIFSDGSDHRDVLNTWFDDPTDFPHPPKLEKLAESAGYDSVDVAMKTATEAHKTLQALYEHRAEKAVIEPEEEFFTSLAEGHEAEVRRIVMSLEEFTDL
ncbi:2-hydroxyacyl-CoA dehydratase [Halomonas vilamensis]|uniref:2-hydroxyacyl-CoA dehydratase n=1 Tax=Vreelandella vilamensis TaxID=531309 RepID=A0ABU1H7K2_9GAMM|nr:2-hydroxyacyl-CoA dehydratase [Halomonas vilamensis]MDR5899652.1 2-hydroxyacyl-CoA dehydratase [Halomonas vilamensis]